MANERKYCDWSIVLNAPEAAVLTPTAWLNHALGQLRTVCTDLITSRILDFPQFACAAIIHDCDTEPNGNPKTVHAHIVLHCGGPVTKTRLLNFLASVFSDDEGNDCPLEVISAEKVKNMHGAIRYLCHLDDESKFQYCPSYIEGSSDWYLRFLERNDVVDFVAEQFAKGVTGVQIMRKMGRHWWLANRLIVLDYIRLNGLSC